MEAQQIEISSKKIDTTNIDFYNGFTATLEKKAGWIDKLRATVDPTNADSVAFFNGEVNKFNKEIGKLDNLQPGVNKTINEIDALNKRISNLESQSNKAIIPTAPVEPPRELGNIGRQVLESQIQEFNESTRNRDGFDKVLAVSDFAATVLVPLYWTKNAAEMSNLEKGINLGLDALILFPFLRMGATSLRAAFKEGGTAAVRSFLSNETKAAKVTVNELKRLFGGETSQAFEVMAARQRRLFDLANRLEIAKIKGKPVDVLKRAVTGAELRLKDAGKKYIDNLQNAEGRLITNAEREMIERTGLDPARITGPRIGKLKPRIEVDVQDIVTHTRTLAESAAREIPKQAVNKLEKKLADVELVMHNMQAEGWVTKAKPYRDVQKRVFQLKSELARARMGEVQRNYYELL